MERIALTPRANWQQIVEKRGLIWHTIDSHTIDSQTIDSHSVAGQAYWNESACYRFTGAEVDTIEAASAELYRLCMEAGQHVIDNDLFGRFGIPDYIAPLIRRAWDEEPPALNHGRFDLGYDGVHPPKMFEYNCDTPTAMFEAAVIQWEWKEAVFPRADQFNSLHDKLLGKWKDIASYLKSQSLHFTHVNDSAGEDTLTVAYLRDLAAQAGLKSTAIFTKDIGWNAGSRRFVDLDNRPIDVLFHLYPWEWLTKETFGPHIVESYDAMDWIEPVWKMMLSNKAILPVLWELFPGHPNLLPCFYDRPGATYVKKPFLGREGANISVEKDGRTLAETAGTYGGEGYVYQELFELPDYGGNRPVIGSWIVDGEPAGMGIREDGLITGNTARFVPHVFE